MKDYAAEPNSLASESVLKQNKAAYIKYAEFREDVRQGCLGKTAQFWLMYLDLMQIQNLIHIAVQENDFELRLTGWKYFLPFYFALNKTNYARYGSFYVHFLERIESVHPGLKEMLQRFTYYIGTFPILSHFKQPQA